MALVPCMPESTAIKVRNVALRDRHPGLVLDKPTDAPEKQEDQREAVENIVKTQGDPELLRTVNDKRTRLLNTLDAGSWNARTVGPMTIHLARASALENAGICLHPIYGFVYLPGSGLKGMARAYAETIWLPSHPDDETAKQKFFEVFGNKPGEKDEAKQTAGAIVFHDAWPVEWPKLVCDILNNHHTKYYNGDDAPGDWEDPTMVSFLAVKDDTEFNFAVSKRRNDVSDGLRDLAKEWLSGALYYLGAGAKTNAGYGTFKPCEGNPPTMREIDARKTFKATLELVTPAFLAGAEQSKDDCDLRPATLRGLLRWWWRTMHAAHVDVATLRKLETAIWGDAKNGGAVRVSVERLSASQPMLFNYKDGFAPKTEFKNAHSLEEAKPRTLPDGSKKFTTQGLFYAAYGMDENTKEGVRQRYYRNLGDTWKVRLIARETDLGGNRADADTVLKQARASLWLLTHFGAVGSKSRKGFGSFSDSEELSLLWCKENAAIFRSSCRVETLTVTEPPTAALDVLTNELVIDEVQTSWKDPWFAIDQVGFAYETFTQNYAHKSEKLALGLPRKIHGPNFRPLKHQNTHQQPQNLRSDKGERYASPVHIHLGRPNNGTYTVRVIAFPAKYLPDWEHSKAFLKEFIDHLRKDIETRKTKSGKAVPANNTMGGRSGDEAVVIRHTDLKNGDKVDAVLLEERSKKGNWKAKTEGSTLGGAIINSDDVPADKNPGDHLSLIVHSVSSSQISFRVPKG